MFKNLGTEVLMIQGNPAIYVIKGSFHYMYIGKVFNKTVIYIMNKCISQRQGTYTNVNFSQVSEHEKFGQKD